MITVQKFKPGDTVYIEVSITRDGMKKRRVGQITDLSNHGIQLQFPNEREKFWFRASQVKHLYDKDPSPPAPKEPLVVMSPPPSAPKEPPPAAPTAALRELEQSGDAAFAEWLKRGEAILAHAEAKLAKARDATKEAREMLTACVAEEKTAEAHVEMIRRATGKK